jgi:hypothetical protein
MAISLPSVVAAVGGLLRYHPFWLRFVQYSGD